MTWQSSLSDGWKGLNEMKLYEFINPSDEITFYAPDNDIAEAIALFVGNGKAGIKAIDGNEVPSTITFLSGMPDEQLERVKATLSKRLKEVLAAGKTFAVCGANNRKEYDDYTKNGQDEKKVNIWDNKHRTSLSDWCGYARGLKIKALKTEQPEK